MEKSSALERVQEYLKSSGTTYKYSVPEESSSSVDEVRFSVVFSRPTRQQPVPQLVINATFKVDKSSTSVYFENSVFGYILDGEKSWNDEWIGLHVLRKQKMKDLVMVQDPKDAEILATMTWNRKD